MSAITFDAIKYMDDLVEAGVPESQAKVQSKTLTNAIEDLTNKNLATKGDIKSLEGDIKSLEYKLGIRLIRLEILMSIMLAVLLIPVIKDFLV